MAQKDNSSATEIIKNYSAQLLVFIRNKVGRLEDAEDVLQDVWYQLSRLTNVQELENTGAWLYKVAKNKITDLYRKRTNDWLEDYTYDTEDEELGIKDILLLDENSNPDLALFKEVFWKELMAALEELPEKQKQVFILNEIEGKTLQEIADMQQENIKTIISRKGYAMKHLRKRLQDLYNDLN
jgi:RNA polymerase sigma factor (sigma-70 family)